MAAQQVVPLKGLFAGDQEGATSVAAVAQHLRKKASRSPLRARQAQQSSSTLDLESAKLGLLKSRSGSPDANTSLMNGMMMKKEEEGSAAPRTPHSYINPIFTSKPTTPRDWSNAGGPENPWESGVAGGKETNDGTHLIRLLADFIEEFQFGSNHGKGEYANWVHDPKSLPLESRHSHQLAGQLRKLADVFDSELKER